MSVNVRQKAVTWKKHSKKCVYEWLWMGELVKLRKAF